MRLGAQEEQNLFSKDEADNADKGGEYQGQKYRLQRGVVGAMLILFADSPGDDENG